MIWASILWGVAPCTTRVVIPVLAATSKAIAILLTSTFTWLCIICRIQFAVTSVLIASCVVAFNVTFTITNPGLNATVSTHVDVSAVTTIKVAGFDVTRNVAFTISNPRVDAVG